MDPSLTMKTILVELKKEKDALTQKINETADAKKRVEVLKKIKKCVKELTEVKNKASEVSPK